MMLIFMRHGRTNFNDLGLCNDNPGVDVHLTAEGTRQAEQAALLLRDSPVDCIFVSALPRTRQTAVIVNRYHQAPLHEHSALNDIRTGFDSRPVSEYFAALRNGDLQARAPGGESLLQHKQRVWGFLDWLRTQSWQHVLIVAHEETYRVVAAYCDNLSDAAMVQLSLENCAIRRFHL